MTKWKSFDSGKRKGYIVIARNVTTGKLVNIPLDSLKEKEKLNWYPKTDYVPLKIKRRK